jgi:hypothetical protein
MCCLLAACGSSRENTELTTNLIQTAKEVEKDATANEGDICFFIPPKDWEIANPEVLAPRVHICFLGKTSTGVRPSVNLATEVVDVTLDAYINEVRKIHSSDPNARWRDLGTYKCLLGEGRLTELEIPTDSGLGRMIQLIVIKDRMAYILTASAGKEDFSKYYKTFDQVLRSLQSSSDLAKSYPLKSEELTSMIANLNHKYREVDSEIFEKEIWPTFERKIINDFTEMGPYWQILLLNEQRTKFIN